MSTSIFVNLPVSDVDRARAFHEALGFTIDDGLSDVSSACVIVSEHICLMVLGRAKFDSFAPRPAGDPSRTTSVLIALTCDSREAVDAMLAAAVANGGSDNGKPQEIDGVMYGQSFSDPDGNVFEPFWMNARAAT